MAEKPKKRPKKSALFKKKNKPAPGHGVKVTPEKVIKKRRSDLNLKAGYIDLLKRIITVTLSVYLIFTFVFSVSRAEGMSMYPALKDGDLLISYRLQKKYEKNDVVVFVQDGKKQAGRILAFEGDVVHIDENGYLAVNGTVQSGEILYPTYPKEKLKYPYEVPAGECFILCDYRTKCTDSRDFGTVPVKDVTGKVITVLRRRGI